MGTEQAPSKVLDTVIALSRLALVLLLPAMGWVFNETLAHRDAIVGIQATRFTHSDGIAIEQRVESKFDSIHTSIGIMRADIATLPREVPPAWLLERIARLEAREEHLDARITELISIVRTLQVEIESLKK